VDRFGLVTSDDRFRMLQPSELRRIMGFPVDYHLAGTRRDQVKLLGNAVCPPVMQAIVEDISS
jgi:DNA (cytosine-5)-methyltransferase 1